MIRPEQSLSYLADDHRPLSRKGRIRGVAMSVAAHGAVIASLFAIHSELPIQPDPPAMTVSLVNPAPPPPPTETPSPAPPSPSPPAPPKSTIKKVQKPPPDVKPVVARVAEVTDIEPVVSESELAGAATAGNGSGSGGGSCDMARIVQEGLRKDHLVQNALAGSSKAHVVWNGDWVRSGGEDGKGIAAVREAIIWEVGFAPAACRQQPMRGLVLISLGEGPGSPRVVVGAGSWRWSELLHAR